MGIIGPYDCGYGYGVGYGDGVGYGYGDGYGGGYGGGYGYGYGGDDDFNGFMAALAESLCAGYVARGTLAYWWSDADGRSCNGGTRDVVAHEGLSQRTGADVAVPCTDKSLHATSTPFDGRWSGSRLWLVDLHGDVVEENDKLAATERYFVREVLLNWI